MNRAINISRVQAGFSLIELMVVVVIIGVLGSMAVPVYKDYVIRTKVTELLAVAQPAKLAVTEAIMSGTPIDQIDNNKIGVEKIENKGRIKELSISAGVITITGDSKALDISDNKILKILLTPKSEGSLITWNCSAEPADLKKYTPNNCRG